MPRHLISEAHEWTNKNIAVFCKFLVKLLLKERFWLKQRGKKCLLSLTFIFCRYFFLHNVEYSGVAVNDLNEIPKCVKKC